MSTHGRMLICRIVHSKTLNECALPLNFTKASPSSPQYFKLSWFNQIIYTTWNGRISASSNLELYVAGRSQNFPSDGERVQLDRVNLYVVSDVFLKPCTSFDWDIVTSQAEFIETNLLRNRSIVFKGETLQIAISDSIVANLTVQKIQCKLAGITDSKEIDVGKLTNATSLIIEPYAVVTSLSANNRKSHTVVTSSSVNNIQLRLLSPMLSTLDTSYFFHDSNVVVDAVTSNNDCDTALDEFFTLSETLQQQGQDCHDNKSSDSYSTVYVHPLLFQSVFASLSGTALCDWSDASINDFNVWMDKNQSSHGYFYGMLRRSHVNGEKSKDVTTQSAASDETELQSLCASVMVRVVACTRTRPNFIRVSKENIIALGLDCDTTDCEMLSLSLLEDSDVRSQIPQTILLTPIEWTKSTAAKKVPSSSSSTVSSNKSVVTSRATVNGRDIAIQHAFVNWMYSQQQQGSTVLLQDGQLISLHYWISSTDCDGANSDNVCTTTAVGGKSVSEQFLVSFLPKKSIADHRDGRTVPQHVILNSNDGSFDTILSRCLNVISVSRETVKCLGKWNDDIDNNDNMLANAESVAGLERTCRAVMSDVMPTLLPDAILSRLRRDIKPPVGMLLTGATGTGKTSVLKYVLRTCQHCPRILARTFMIDCASLQSLSVEKVLMQLKEVFASAQNAAPAVICLDNLHVICPSVEESGIGTVKDERCSLITLHLERLLQDNYQRQLKNHDHCVLLAHSLKLLSGNEKPCNVDQDVYFAKEHLISKTLSTAVYVVGTTTTLNAVQSRLVNHDCLRRTGNVNAITSSDRMRVFSAILNPLGTPMSVTATNSSDPSVLRDVERVKTLTEGFRLCDYWALATRVKAALIIRVMNQNAGAVDIAQLKSQLTVSPLDIVQAADSFTPISSSTINISSKLSEISWENVGGFKKVKQAILEVIRLPLLYHRLYRLSPVKMPRALMLYGPPGCGKTFIAQAAGREFGMDFIAIRGPQLLDKYIGASEKAVRDLFNRAKDTGRPTLLFFDEFEALAPKRGKDNTGITDRIVNQLLTFIDGVEGNMGGARGGDGSTQVFIIVATSRPDLIDGALLRPGRIEKHVYIGSPCERDRVGILNKCLSTLHIDSVTVPENVTWISQHDKAKQMTAADYKAVVNTAFLLAAHEIIDNNNSSLANNTSIVVISGQHLKQAFEQTRPSVSHQDQLFYQQAYHRFKPTKVKSADHSQDSVTTQKNMLTNQKMSFH